jgi:hypothetical protein
VAVSNKSTSKIAAILCTAASFLATPAGSTNTPPTAADVNNLTEMARLTTERFMQESFRLRMQYEYSGKFPNESDKEQLGKLAKKASDELQAVANKQRQLKQQIEGYEGSDWDDRFGVTGLWRKLSGDVYTTELAQCEIDYYSCLTVDRSPLQATHQQLREQIISLDSAHSSAYSKLLRAKIIALARVDSAWPILANDILSSLTQKPDINDTVYFRAALEKIKLTNLGKQGLITSLAEELAQSDYSNDLELVLPLAFEQRRSDPNSFEKTINLFPQTEDFLGSLLLSDLSHRIEETQSAKQILRQVSVFEAELATHAAWIDNPKTYKALLNRLTEKEKFQTPLILYVTAIAFSESSPTKAVNLLIKASKLQNPKKSNKLNVEAQEIAKQAAQLAYSLVAQDSTHCELALQAFENYAETANEKIDEKLEYLYAIVLNDCGKVAKGKELLQKIADRPAGRWRDRARFELTAIAIRQRQYENPEQKSRLLKQFSSLIAGNKDCSDADGVLELLSEVIDEIERYETKENSFAEMVQGYEKIAQFSHDCLGQRRSALLLAEVLVLTAAKDEERLSEAEKLLNEVDQDKDVNDVNLLRCRARFLMAQGKFDQAARLWARAADMRKAESPSAKNRSWKWWRAKYYEIYCWSETAGTEKADVIHTIEVLENSFTDVPPLWAERLNSLKRRSQTDE